MRYLITRYVLGGVHMTNIVFLPNALLKEVTGTEYHHKIFSFFKVNHDLKELDRQQGRAFAMENHKSWRDRRDPISSVTGCADKPSLVARLQPILATLTGSVALILETSSCCKRCKVGRVRRTQIHSEYQISSNRFKMSLFCERKIQEEIYILMVKIDY